MKLFIISDFHQNFDILEKLIFKINNVRPDAVFFNGDVVLGHMRGDAWFDSIFRDGEPVIDKVEIQEEIEYDSQTYDKFYSALNSLDVPVFAVPGNMDAPFSNLLNSVEKYKNINIIHQKTVDFNGYTICGFGGEITEKKHEDELVNVFSRKDVEDFFLSQDFNDKKLIFVFHTPPVSKVDIEQSRHKGSEIVNDVLNKIKPQVCFCGHAHYAKGNDFVGNTLVINPGSLSHRNYCVFDIEEMEICFDVIE